MEKGMVEVKENLWSRIKKLFQRMSSKGKEPIESEEKGSNERTEQPTTANYSQKYEVESQKGYRKVNVRGKEVRCFEESARNMYSKRYLIPGEKEVSYQSQNGIDTKRFVVYGFMQNPSTIRGMSFIETTRDKRLDKEIIKTTNQGIDEEISRGPLLDKDNNQYKGRYEIKETKSQSGKRTVEENKDIIDKNGNTQSLKETHSYLNNGHIHTKYLNGQVIFQLVRDENGTTIKEYDNNGNVINAYKYDKDGKPTEYINAIGPNGRPVRMPKTYRGINQIPDDKPQFVNGAPVFSKEYSEYVEALNQAGLSKEMSDTFNNVYEEHVLQRELTDFEEAREQFMSNQDRTTPKYRQENMDK